MDTGGSKSICFQLVTDEDLADLVANVDSKKTQRRWLTMVVEVWEFFWI